MKYFVLCATFLLSLLSCSYDELRKSIDELEERLRLLEDYCGQVRSDLESIQDIIEKLQDDVTVDSITNDESGYTIYFSDGTSITIHNGEDGLTPPKISVIEEDGAYWWGYTYPDGTKEFILDENGEKIPVTGTAPMIRINEDNEHWEISTDGGKTWEDTGVSASGDSSALIKDITEDGMSIHITLSDGTVLTLPKTSELKCIIDAEGTIWFRNGERKEIECQMSGYKTVTIIKPDGWKASLDNGILAITAPVAENTFAETYGTISLILTSENGYSLQADISVATGTGFQFEVSLNGLTADVTVTPSDNETYYFTDMIRTQSIVSYGDTYEEQLHTYVSALADMYLSMGLPAEQVLEMMCSRGIFTKTYQNLLPDTEYIIYGVPVDGNCTISGIPSYTIVMSASTGDPTQIDVTFSISGLTSRTVTVNAVPNDKTIRYWWSITESGTSSDEILNSIDLNTLLERSSIGDDNYNYTGLSPETEYVPYYFGMNEDGTPASEIRFGDPFTTPEAIVSEAYVEIRYDKYYNGDDIAAAFPDYSKAAGHAFVRLTAYENSSAADYLYAVLDGDLTDAGSYPDEDAIQDLIVAGHNAYMSTYYLEWEKDYTITAVAIDSDGNYGKVFRRHEIFTKEGASPLDGFSPISSPDCLLNSLPVID